MEAVGNMDLESEATLVREAQRTLNYRHGLRGLRGPNGVIAAPAAAREARGSDNARAVTSSKGYTRSVRETVYRLNHVQFHPAEKDQAVNSIIWKELSNAFYSPLFLKL